jgi:hypothetical protein
MQCSDCGFNHVARARRSGFLEARILPLFGFYPWKCPKCKTRFLFHYRGKKKTKLAAPATSQN